MSQFVGASRVGLVDGLVDLFTDVRDSGESRWVSLEAPSGWGKTRVGREFYARLAAGQSSPRYWPDVIADPNRKAVVPKGKRPPGSLPEFLWWGVSCSDRNGVAAEALRSDLGQLKEHAPLVDVVCKHGRDLKEKVIQGFLKTRAALVSTGAKTLAGNFVPGVGLAVFFARIAVGAAREHRQDRVLMGEESEIGAGGRELVEQVIDELCVLGNNRFPIVLFIEDVHLADTALLEVIEGLLRRGSHILVITTTWPGKIDDIGALAGLDSDLGERALRVGYLGPAGPPFPDGAGLMELDVDDCAQIVCANFPQADPTSVELLVNRYRNPWALELVCNMPKYRHKFGERGDLHIDPEEIAALPSGTKELYKKYWEHLPERLRLRYAVAAAITPEAINPQKGQGHRTWSDPVLDEVIDSIDLPNSADLAGAVGAARDAYGWVAHVDEFLRRWAETDQHHIATNDGNDKLNEHLSNARQQILSATARVMVRDRVLRTHDARSIIALHAEGFIADPAPVTAAIAVVLADIGHDETLITQRQHLYNLYLELYERAPNSVDNESDLQTRLNGINSIRSSGQPDLAARQYRDLITHTKDTFGADHFRTLKTLNNLALALQEAGRVEEAIGIYERVLADRTRVLGGDHPDTLTTLNNLAWARQAAGRVEEAIGIYERVLADRTRVLGSDHPHTLTTLNNLAWALQAAGRLEEAVTLFDRVFADQTRVLGSDHPHTLTTCNNLALALQEAGRLEEAVTLFHRVFVDQTRVLGSDHPHTLTTCNNLALALQAAGRLEEAVTLFDRVFVDQTRVLGSDHPHTLTTRNNLALALQEAGRLEEAVAIYEEVLASSVRVLGSDHPHTLTTRNNLALALQEAGRLEEAVAIYGEVLASSVRVLGSDHPHTLTTRNNLAWALQEAGRLEEAIPLLEQVLSDWTRVLGSDHPHTLTTRNNLASALQATGRAEDTVTQFEQ